MSDTIYRPLFAVVEALEGVVKAKLPAPVPAREPSRLGELIDHIRLYVELRDELPGFKILQDSLDSKIYLSCRCSLGLCKQHVITVDEERLSWLPSWEWADEFLGALDRLAAYECKADIGLRPGGKP